MVFTEMLSTGRLIDKLPYSTDTETETETDDIETDNDLDPLQSTKVRSNVEFT